MRVIQKASPLIGVAEDWVCYSCRRRHDRGHVRTFYSRETQNNSFVTRPKRKHGTAPETGRSFSRRTFTSHAKNAATASVGRNAKLPDYPARTRFAPSPTGHMHIGGLRTALFSFLLAKRTNGQFILRIEDTDQKRFVPGAEERLCEDLQWAGIHWDEGPQVGGPYGPYKQSERTPIYTQHAQTLLDAGSAYRCFCTPQTTDSSGMKAAYVTSGCYQDCSSLDHAESHERASSGQKPFTVRLKPPVDAHKRVYTDLIYGKIQRLKRSPSVSLAAEDASGAEAADTILIKSDGTPTYHFANVVDDHLMKITHVIRGSEWMASTPLHYDLYTAFDWRPPVFAHVGLLVDQNQAKLSKRSDTGLVLDARGMREHNGILSEVLCNFLALLGWSNPGRNDVLELQELIRDFDLKFTKGNTIVRLDKLWYLQKQHVSRRCELAKVQGSSDPLVNIVSQIQAAARSAFPEATSSRFPTDSELRAYCTEILLADSKSYTTPQAYIERNGYFFTYDAARVPASPSFYDIDKTISAQALTDFTCNFLNGFDFHQSYRDSSFSLTPSSDPNHPKLSIPTPSKIDTTSTLIHAAINNQIWHTILSNHSAISNDSTTHLPETLDPNTIPFTDQPLDISRLALALVQASTNPATPEQQQHVNVERLVQTYKNWNRALMKFLREKLSYGQPGPGVGVIMAILGYRETCRRLGVDVGSRKGW